MILPDFKDFPRTGRILGVDWGQRRVGVAISDDSQDFVFPRNQINNDDKNNGLISGMLEIINSEKIRGIVIGLPIRSNGDESETTKNVRKFAESLSKQVDLPIIFIDESLTSFAAEDNLVGIRHKKKILDSESARIILENAIAMINRNRV